MDRFCSDECRRDARINVPGDKDSHARLQPERRAKDKQRSADQEAALKREGSKVMASSKPTIKDSKNSETRTRNVFWMDFMFACQRIRESTNMTSRIRAREVENKHWAELRDGGTPKMRRLRYFSVASAEWTEVKERKWPPAMAGIAQNALQHLLPVFSHRLLVDVET